MDQTITHTVVAAVYYIFLIPLAILSAFGIYIFIRYGRTIMISFVISAIYIVFFLILVSISHGYLQKL